MLPGERQIRRRPGTRFHSDPGPSSAAPVQAFPQALYACRARVLSSAGGIGAVREQSYRLYSCQRCGMQVRICRRCDHGNIYCPRACAQIRRRESVRRAGSRYQRTSRGACCHAARQRAWRSRRKQKVTHQSCTSCERRCSVSDTGITARESTDACHTRCSDSDSGSFTVDRCSFCQSILPRWTRVRAGSWLI